MGTLFNQPERKWYTVTHEQLAIEIERVARLAKAANIAPSEVIELTKVLEYRRRTDLMVHDQDAKDEQLAGFGDILKELITAISELKSGDIDE